MEVAPHLQEYGYMTRNTLKTLIILAVSSTLVSCSLFSGGNNPEKNTRQHRKTTPSASAFRNKIMADENKFVCLYAISGKPYTYINEKGIPSGIEIGLIRNAAQNAKLNVEFILVEKDQITPALRNGTGDVACGALEKSYMENAGFETACSYKTEKGEYAAAIRKGDSFLTAKLKPELEKIDIQNISAKYGPVVSDAKVILKDDTENGTVSIKVNGGE